MSVLFAAIMILCTGFLSASLASFLGVVAERSIDDSSVNGRSHCACGRNLKWYENVPVIGWLRAGGKAKCCGARIPAFLFVTELIAFICGGITGWFWASFMFEYTTIVPALLASAATSVVLINELWIMHYLVHKNAKDYAPSDLSHNKS